MFRQDVVCRLFACKDVGGVGVGRSAGGGVGGVPILRRRAQVRMEGCGGEWFGVSVPRLFLFVGALHPNCRHYTSSVRVHRHVTGAPPRNGCSAPVLVVAVGVVGSSGLELSCLGCLLLGVFVVPHVVVPQKCRT